MGIKKTVRIFANKILQPIGYRLVSVSQNPLKVKNVSRLAQFQLFEGLFERIKNVSGDIVECGVGTAGSFFLLAYFLLQEENKKRLLWGFDSFAGFPAIADADQGGRAPEKGEWGDTSISLVLKLLSDAQIPESFVRERVRLVKGFFTDSLKNFPDRKIGFLHIDADLYQSYKDVFKYLGPRLSSGATVVFDEYLDPKWPGATKAIDEFRNARNLKLDFDSRSGKYFVFIP